MTIRRLLGSLAMLTVLASAAHAADLEIPLTVTETAGVARTNEPVTTGVPLPKGAVKDVSTLMLKDEAGKQMPAQFRALAPYPDGSVRVVLVDTQVSVPANGSAKLILTDGAAVAAGASDASPTDAKKFGPAAAVVSAGVVPAGPKISVDDTADSTALNTGPLELTVSKKSFNLFKSLKLSGKEIMPDGARIVLTTEDGKTVTTGDVAPTEVKLEEQGLLRSVIRAKGSFAGLHNKMLTYTCRITAFAGKPFVKVSFWLEDDGKYGWVGEPEWFVFKGLAIELPVKAKNVESPLIGREEGKILADSFELNVTNSSGRGNKLDFQTGLIFDKARVGEAKSKLGPHMELPCSGPSDGWLTLISSTGVVNVAVKDFWQNYPRALRVKEGTLSIDLWPVGGHWPRECAGREKYAKCNEGVRKADCYSFPGGMHKRHEMIFDFAKAEELHDMKSTAATLDQPLMALASSKHFADCGALTPFAPADFHPADDATAKQVDRWNLWARHVADPKNPTGIDGSKAVNTFGPNYGVMDFGDLFWWEGVSSLHYDWTWIMMLNYVRLQDRYFLDKAAEMAKHRIDVDQVWSDRELPIFGGLCRFEMGYVDIHGGNGDGWYKPIPSHNWDRGPLWWYYLTGDPTGYECVKRNCELGIKVRQVDAHANDAEGKNLGDQPRCSGWSIGCLCDAYDMTGDKKFLDWAETLWKTHLMALWKKSGPTFGNTGPNTLQFYYLTHDLVLLHMRTGDADLLAYMHDLVKALDANPTIWTKDTYPADMAINMSNFYGYLAWVDKDAKLLARARELFAAGLPKDDNQLILWTGTGGYTKEAGKPLRNGHIYLWAERQLAAEGENKASLSAPTEVQLNKRLVVKLKERTGEFIGEAEITLDGKTIFGPKEIPPGAIIDIPVHESDRDSPKLSVGETHMIGWRLVSKGPIGKAGSLDLTIFSGIKPIQTEGSSTKSTLPGIPMTGSIKIKLVQQP